MHHCYAFVRPEIPTLIKRVSGSPDGSDNETDPLEKVAATAHLEKAANEFQKKNNVDDVIRDLMDKIKVK